MQTTGHVLWQSILRTLVPVAVGAVIGWLASAGITVDPEFQTALDLTLMGLGAIYLIAKPASATAEHDEPPLDRHVLSKVVGCVVMLSIYAAVFELLGFIPASILFAIAMARLYEGSWKVSVIAGVALSVGLYLLFDKALDVPLPLGILAALEN